MPEIHEQKDVPVRKLEYPKPPSMREHMENVSRLNAFKEAFNASPTMEFQKHGRTFNWSGVERRMGFVEAENVTIDFHPNVDGDAFRKRLIGNSHIWLDFPSPVRISDLDFGWRCSIGILKEGVIYYDHPCEPWNPVLTFRLFLENGGKLSGMAVTLQSDVQY